MGRVSRYKKIKSIDPYSKKNKGAIDLESVGVWGLSNNGQKAKKRSRRSEMLRSSRGKKMVREGFNLPPEDHEDDFDLADLLGSVKKQKLPVLEESTKTEKSRIETTKLDVPQVKYTGKVSVPANDDDDDDGSDNDNGSNIDDDDEKNSQKEQLAAKTKKQLPKAFIPETSKEERESAKFLKIESKLKEAEQKKAEERYKRMPGESKRAFARRTKEETRNIIRNETTQTKSTEKAQRKKEFLKEKKKRKRKGGGSRNNNKYANMGGDYDSDRDDGRSNAVDEVRFGEQAERPPVFKHLPRGSKEKKQKQNSSNSNKKHQGMSEERIAAERNEMEEMRRRVQEQYATIKARRKQAGDFHL